ncbi:DUF1501 domain-containing protein [Aliagarivorans marinus]|uniref:DUF1501 domain-containing protein n=1 Tax=Aliagarivorans marinus TaxID=561965 RepID=UPI0003F9FD73|nr:DUF1501 domain-containing protein [Aliagarivorans marinus]
MDISRRSFLKRAAALSGYSIAPFALTLPAGALAAEGDDYKALVCVFLPGGSDSFNMLLPAEGPNYDNYVLERPNVHLTASEILDIPGFTDEQGQLVRLTSAMPKLAQMIAQGRATALLNVGTLIEPTDKDNFDSVLRPPGLGAHNSQQDVWQRSWNGSGYHDFGWLGMALDLLNGVDQPVLSNSLAVRNDVILQGQRVTPLELSDGEVGAIEASAQSNTIKDNIQQMLDKPWGSAFYQEYLSVVQEIVDFQSELDALFAAFPEDESIPDTDIGRQMRTVKRMVDAATALGHQRQVFCVKMGGFDTHSDQRPGHEDRLARIDEALAAFYDSLAQAGLEQQVVSFTLSEFGRTIQNNGNLGTDHGWGGNQLVWGGPLNRPGKAFGRYPEFVRDGVDARDNKFIPALSSEQMAATLCSWLGLSETSIDLLFPALHPDNDNPFPSRYLGFLGEGLPSSTVLVLEDCFVRNGQYSEQNYDGENLMVKSGAIDYQREAYLKFDVSNEKLASVRQLLLRLYVVQVGRDASRDVSVSQASTGWDEQSLTWLTRPGVSSAGRSVSEVTTDHSEQWVELDITALAQNAADTSLLSLCVSVSSAWSDQSHLWFASKESAPELMARLVFNY